MMNATSILSHGFVNNDIINEFSVLYTLLNRQSTITQLIIQKKELLLQRMNKE